MSSRSRFENREQLEAALRFAFRGSEPEAPEIDEIVGYGSLSVGEPEPSPGRGAFLEAAAVVGPFPPQALEPVGAKALDPTVRVSEIAADCSVTSGGRWLLNVDVRRETLTGLVEQGRLREALEATVALEAVDPYRRVLGELAAGRLGPLGKASLDELRHLHQVVGWFGEPNPYDLRLDEIARAIDHRALVEPFYKLAGGGQFHGRQQELDMLRDFVEVYEASSVGSALSKGAMDLLKIERRRPTVVFGPGGIGKSALLARFILDHAEIESTERLRAGELDKIPYAYLDFDDLELDPLRPETLLIRIALQLVKQYPDEKLEHRARDWHRRIRQDQQRGPRTAERGARRMDVKSDGRMVEHVLDSLNVWLRERVSRAGAVPFLLVLDTFEEIQLGGEARERRIAELISQLEGIYPRLRVVICGRAKVRFLRAKHHALEGLDTTAAADLLNDRGVDQADLREAIVKRVGTSPLSLILAAEAVAEERRAAGEAQEVSRVLDGIRTRNLLLQRVDAAEIQGQLYDRILKHVRDLRVRKLAHPGLVLRRITAEVIARVLAEPCGLEPDDAEELFEALGRDVSLVERNPDGSLQHRADVRRIMLRNMLGGTRFGKAIDAIHRGAVRYYEDLDDPVARAEEVYHRLMLGQIDSGLESRAAQADRRGLETAMEDPLPPRSKAWLASHLGWPQADVDWEAADLDDWEQHAAAEASALLDLGDAKRALALVRQRKERSEASPLLLLEARAHAALGQHEQAREIVDAGLERTLEAGKSAMAVELYEEGARSSIALGDAERFERYLSEGLELVRTEEDAAARLELLKLRYDGRRGLPNAKPSTDHDVELVQAFLGASKDVLRSREELTRSIVAELGDLPQVLERGIGVLKPAAAGPGGEKGLARLFKKAEASADFRRHKGELLQQLGVSDTGASWQQVASQSVRYGTLDKALQAVVRYGDLGAKDLRAVTRIVTSDVFDDKPRKK